MEWHLLKETKPNNGEQVLIASHTTDDPNWVDFFIASWFEEEKEWFMHIFFRSGEPYVRIERKSHKTDRWARFTNPLDEAQ